METNNTNSSENTNHFRWFHVDDDLDDLDIYKSMIAEAAPTVVLESFTSSIHLIRRLNSLENIPRLILIDLNMPVMDGFTCLKHVKILPHIKNFTRLVMLSTSSDKELINQCYNAGAHFYAIKPSDPVAIKALVLKLTEIADTDYKWPIAKKQFLLNDSLD